MTKLTLINTNLRRYTFQSPKIRKWVESRAVGKTLNLFAGRTLLNIDEVRNDMDPGCPADYHVDALDFILDWREDNFNTIILDPPYSYRKSMEMYKNDKTGRITYESQFRRIADLLSSILYPDGIVISFGYHSSFMGKGRGFELVELCVFAHGGAQHCTIGIVEKRKEV